MYSDGDIGGSSKASYNPTGIDFVAFASGGATQTLPLNTGTPLSDTDNRGYYGNYTFEIYVATSGGPTTGTLDIGFDVSDATCNWLAFKNLKVVRIKDKDGNAVSTDVTASAVTNAACTTVGDATHEDMNVEANRASTAVANWQYEALAPTAPDAFHENTWSGNAPEQCPGFDGTPYLEYWRGWDNGYLRNTWMPHNQITGLENGDYLITVDARVYSEAGTTEPASARFYAQGKQVNLDSGTPANNNCGYYGTYRLVVPVTDGNLDFGFNIFGVTFNWLAFKNLKLYKLVDGEDKTSDVPNYAGNNGYANPVNGAAPEGETPNGWEIAGNSNGVFHMNNHSDEDFPAIGSRPFAEYWVASPNTLSDATISRTLTDLPAGVYKLTIAARMYSENSSVWYPTGVSLFANEQSTPLHRNYNATGFDIEWDNGRGAGFYATYTVDAIVGPSGVLNFGFKVKDATCNWLAFKALTLTYYGTYPDIPNGLMVSDGLPASLATLKSTKTPVSANDVKNYLVRFTNNDWTPAEDHWGSGGQYWRMQMGTGNYVSMPASDGASAECGSMHGSFYVYSAEGTRYDSMMEQDLWTQSNESMLVKATEGGDYLYYMHDNGVDNVVSYTVNPLDGGRWGVDITGNIPFTLYPVDVCESSPTTPDLAAPETSTTSAPKFYKIKSVGQDDYVSYSSITASQYPQLVDRNVGGYAIMGRTAAYVTGNSYWWFSDASSEGYQNQASKGSKRVHIHNVMMHDVDYSYENHRNEALYSPIYGMVRMYRDDEKTQPTDSCLYYLLPTTADGQNGFAISRSEYSGTPNDSWYSMGEAKAAISQHSTLAYENNYKKDANSLYTFELADVQDVWADVIATKREDMHEGAYFSPTTKTLDAIFDKSEYQKENITTSNFFTCLEALSGELYRAATDASLPTLAPETGGRFYFKNYAAPDYYFAYDGGLTISNNLSANNIWEVLPFSDPTLIVRLDDQPIYNGFPSAYYETLPHKPLQRFWLRNRATGDFVTHAPVDKSGYTKLSEGIWNMNNGGWQGNMTDLGTVNSLNREGADLWYLDVVTNPRTGVRTGVLRTLFCYDYGPWTGTSWNEGAFNENGRAIGETGAAIAGYNFPVVQWDMNGNVLKGWGVTATDHTRAFSQWVIYDIDTDLPEVGVNYTFKNKYAKKYAYWYGTSDGGSLKLTESVEYLATAEDELNNNRGVWTLLNLATPADGQYRIANRWAIQKSESNQELLSDGTYKLTGGTGSTFVLPISNVDTLGLAIGVDVGFDFTADSWLNSYENKSAVKIDPSADDKAVWGIDKVDRLYDDVIYDLNKMLGNLHGGDSYFYVDKDAVSAYNAQILKWTAYSGGNRDDINENNEYPTYKTIKDLVNGKIGDDKFVMPVKKDDSVTRFLIRNKETGRYLADMGYLTTVDSTDVNHYAIWDLSLEETESGTKYLYRLTNEGAANEMDAQGDSRKTENPRDYKYLKWDKDAGESAFQMAKSETTYTKLHFRPDGEGYARLHWYKSGDTDLDDDPVLYGPTWGDRVVKSRVLRNNNVYWEVIPVADFLTDERSVDYLKTEKALVQHSINELEGYSGGPISLTDVNSTVVGAGTGSYDLKNLPGAVSGTTGTIASLGTIIRNMWKMDDMFLLQWKPGFPLYVENVFRPSRNARLTVDGDGWTTVTGEGKDDDEASQTFEFETATDGKVYLWNKEGSKYVKASTADDEAVASGTKADGAQLTVKEILPGMYSMMDVAGRYLSIDDDGNVEWTALCGYGSLWRIKCNDYLQPNIAQVPSESTLWPSEYVNTFSSNYDTRIDKTTGVRAYYAKNSANGGLSIGERGDEKQIQILFTEAKNDDDHYYLQGGQPYMLVKTGGKISNDELKVWSQHKGEYEGGTLSGKNLLSLLAEDTEIDETNQRNIFELNYIAPGTVIGQIVGHEVTAFGIGFYPVKKGRTLKKGSVVVNSEMLGNWVKELRKAYNTGSVKGEAWAPSLQIILEDEDGTTTALDELITIEERADGPVYDLSGRKVSDSFRDVTRKGMYIVNGQKVMKK